MSNSISRLLLVEDDEDDYILARDYIEQLSTLEFEIDWVTNQHDALAKMAENRHDICLLDYQLGAENGLTVLKRAIAAGFTSPIIMLTGQADEEVDMAALDAGAVDYIIKSELSSSRFARAIRYALARREIEKERVDRLKAEAENRSKDRFLAHLSHELRTPLTSILGYTELLMDSKMGQSAQSELSIVLSNSKHLLSLLNNMLDLSKIAADKLELNLSEVNLDALIADVYALMSIPATDKGLTLTVISDTPLPLKIQTDATRFRQVLINLISNAIKSGLSAPSSNGKIESSVRANFHVGNIQWFTFDKCFFRTEITCSIRHEVDCQNPSIRPVHHIKSLLVFCWEFGSITKANSRG